MTSTAALTKRLQTKMVTEETHSCKEKLEARQLFSLVHGLDLAELFNTASKVDEICRTKWLCNKKGRRCNSVENEVPLIEMASFQDRTIYSANIRRKDNSMKMMKGVLQHG